MKKIITLLLFATAFSLAGTPTMDGTFDGVGVWGSPVGLANDAAGWNNVNVNEVYVTYDASYAYFAASFNTGGAPGGWQYVAFAINGGGGGGGGCPWAAAIIFGHTNKPDFVLIGRLGGNWAALNTWTGSSWSGSGNVYGTDMMWSGDYSYVEGRVLLSTLGNPATCDVQFYVGGDNYTEHGNFDSCPDDTVMLSWNYPTTLHYYISGVTLPIQLASFVGSYFENGAKLEWSTISEVNNYGFNVQRQSGNEYVNIGFVEGKGVPSTYEYIDAQAGTTYRLEQIDNDGLTTYYGPIMLNPNSVGDNPLANGPAVFALNQNYPNPFNPSTKISFSLANAGYTTLKVYNIVGKEVATLFNGNAEAGKQYIANFDAKNLSSGMYFYKLQSGSNVEVKKLTLVK